MLRAVALRTRQKLARRTLAVAASRAVASPLSPSGDTATSRFRSVLRSASAAAVAARRQLARFAFVPQETFVWNADAGDSGAGGGPNQDNARFVRFRDLIYAKWEAARNALVDRVQPMLHAAAAAAQQGDMPRAEAECNSVLAISQNDPWALNLLAMIERATARLAQARATQELAVAVRPGDPDLVYNLALLCREGNDLEAARRYAAHAVSLAPGVAKYRALAGALG